MLVSEMLVEMQDHGFGDLSTVRLLSFLNDAYFDFCTRDNWDFLEAESIVNTVAATATLTTPADLGAIIGITDLTNDRPLRWERRDTMYKQYTNTVDNTSGGQPILFYFHAGAIRLWPIPDGVYQQSIYYLKYPAALTSAPDTSPIFPAAHHRLVVIGALAKAYLMEDDSDLAAIFNAEFDKRIDLARSDLLIKQFDQPDRVIDVFESDNYYT